MRPVSTTSADRVWNRAALEAGGATPGPGDRALASLLFLHGLVMNGGVHHALECMQPEELRAAADAYAFFGLDDVAAFFRGAAHDPMLSSWSDDTEIEADRRYAHMIPNDSHLFARFADMFRGRPDQFAPIDSDG